MKTTIAQDIKALNESARKVHGDDIHLLVCRAVAFGNDDNLVVVQGKNHKAAAMDFAKVIKGATVTEESARGSGEWATPAQSIVVWK